MNDSVTYLMITGAELGILCMSIWFIKQVICGIRALVKIMLFIEKNATALNEIEYIDKK